MIARYYLVMVIVALLFLGFALPGDEEKKLVVDENHAVQPRLEMLYGRHIDGIIENGERQCERLQNTRSSNLQADAEFIARKVEFCRQNREGLIREMVGAGIPTSRNPVNQFIVRRFAGNGKEQTAGLYR